MWSSCREGHAVCPVPSEAHKPNWRWHLEGAYHHLFTNDAAIIALAKELGIEKSLIIKRPITANLIPASFISSASTSSPIGTETIHIAQLDGIKGLFQFPGLTLLDKFRTGALAAFCKTYPFWKTLEHTTAKEFFTKWGGVRAWQKIWEPLMIGKFGVLESTIAASWLWARVHKRTPSLIYIEGGFQTIVSALATAIEKHGGKIFTDVTIDSITRSSSDTQRARSFIIHKKQFDQVLFTTPTPIAEKLLTTSNLLPKGVSLAGHIPHLHAQVLILETPVPILKNIYWLSITDRTYPFLAVVAHTNFMDKKYYGGNHITYIGNYLPHGHENLTMTKQQLLKKFMPYIKKLNSHFPIKPSAMKSYLFTAPFAQPVHQVEYSKKAPPLITPIENIYLANMDSIVPWDRGTNYAVELGKSVAHTMLSRKETHTP